MWAEPHRPTRAEMAPFFFLEFVFLFPEITNSKRNKKNSVENSELSFPVIENYRYIYGLFYSAAYFGTLFSILCNFQLIMKPTWINLLFKLHRIQNICGN
jgi:hypothetical protein